MRCSGVKDRHLVAGSFFMQNDRRQIRRDESKQQRQRDYQSAVRTGGRDIDWQRQQDIAWRRRQERRRKRRRQVLIARLIMGTAAFLAFVGLVFGLWKIGSFLWKNTREVQDVFGFDDVAEADSEFLDHNHSEKPQITEDFLTVNEFSRPGEELPEVTEIFVHYTANAGTTAAQNRSYFENLGITGETSASAHFVIGTQGEIIQCLPLDEIGYAVKEHNYNSISIECCYLKESGEFEAATYQSLIALLGWLMKEYDLGTSAVLRHYDQSGTYGGKMCPKYYVEHEEAWEQLLRDLEAYVMGEEL